VTRQAMLKDAVVEAARQFLAWHLVNERARRGSLFDSIPTSEVVDALQTLRDACAVERAARSGR
jgi:hypothetical protein